MATQLKMYKANQAEIAREYDGKIIAVKDGKVLGVYPSKTEAFDATIKRYAQGEFMVILCTPGDEQYTMRVPLSGRAVFAQVRA